MPMRSAKLLTATLLSLSICVGCTTPRSSPWAPCPLDPSLRTHLPPLTDPVTSQAKDLMVYSLSQWARIQQEEARTASAVRSLDDCNAANHSLRR